MEYDSIEELIEDDLRSLDLSEDQVQEFMDKYVEEIIDAIWSSYTGILANYVDQFKRTTNVGDT